MIPRIFDGQPCIIVGGGPSLAGFSWRALRGRNTIAINRAGEFVPDAKVLWWSDAWFWRQNKAKILSHAAPFKATCQLEYRGDDELPSYIHEYRFTGLDGFDPRPGCLRHGNNSAYAAMHLAAHLGANLIVLLGVDMKHGADGLTHFHGGHGVMHQQKTLTELMLPHFETLAAPLAERGITVLNASPESALTVWRRCTIEEGLNAYDKVVSQNLDRGRNA